MLIKVDVRDIPPARQKGGSKRRGALLDEVRQFFESGWNAAEIDVSYANQPCNPQSAYAVAIRSLGLNGSVRCIQRGGQGVFGACQ